MIYLMKQIDTPFVYLFNKSAIYWSVDMINQLEDKTVEIGGESKHY